MKLDDGDCGDDGDKKDGLGAFDRELFGGARGSKGADQMPECHQKVEGAQTVPRTF